MAEITPQRALSREVTVQDGSWLAELQLETGYEVHAVIRRAGTFKGRRIDHLDQDSHIDDSRLILHDGDNAVRSVGPAVSGSESWD